MPLSAFGKPTQKNRSAGRLLTATCSAGQALRQAGLLEDAVRSVTWGRLAPVPATPDAVADSGTMLVNGDMSGRDRFTTYIRMMGHGGGQLMSLFLASRAASRIPPPPAPPAARALAHSL